MIVRQATQPVTSSAFLAHVLAAMNVNPAAKLIDTPVCKLWKDEEFIPSRATTKAQFALVEADFTDYAAAAMTLEEPVGFSDSATGMSAVANWHIEDAGAITGNTIWGYWIEDANRVIAYERVATWGGDFVLNTSGDTLILVVKLPIPHSLVVPAGG